MADESAEIVGSLGRELVLRLAPEELPLYPSLLSQFEGKNGGRGKASSRDQILGFGIGETMVLLTPVILSFARGFWDALIAEAAQTTLHGVLKHLHVWRSGQQDVPGSVPLTAEQLSLVRTVAEREARRLQVPTGQAKLLADAMVGLLAAPPVS